MFPNIQQPNFTAKLILVFISLYLYMYISFLLTSVVLIQLRAPASALNALPFVVHRVVEHSL